MRQLASPQQEHLYWYLWYFNTERGRRGFNLNRREFCRFLWKLWSPNWHFSDEEYAITAESFDNPDFIDVIIHSYRHRLSNTEGDPSLQEIEDKLAKEPLISVSTIDMDGACDGLDLPGVPLPDDSHHFSDYYERRVIPVVGHFLPRESPSDVIKTVLDVRVRSNLTIKQNLIN